MFKSFFGCLSLLLFISCGNKIVPLQKTDNQFDYKQIKQIIDPNVEELVFDMGIQFKENFNSGILAVVYENTGFYRLVFLTKAGPNLFDLSFTPDKMIVNKSIKALDKKLLWKILEQDFRMIFDHVDFESSSKVLKKHEDVYVINPESNRKQYYYLTNDNLINQVIRGNKKRAFKTLNLSFENQGLKKADLKHHRIPLSLTLQCLSTKYKN